MNAWTKILISLTAGLLAALAAWLWSLIAPSVAEWIGYSFAIMAMTMLALLFGEPTKARAQ